MKKHLKRLGLTLLTLTALLWGYARLIEQRSLTSWGIERLLWMTMNREHSRNGRKKLLTN